MNNTLLNIREFFDWLYQYNWHQFNSIEDGFEQAKEYRGILNRFEVLVLEEMIREGFDSNELYNLIQSQQAIATLPFMGKLHTIVNPYLMKGQLIERVQKAMFETEKKKLSEGICEFELQHSYGQYPDFKNLIKTGTHSAAIMNTQFTNVKNVIFNGVHILQMMMPDTQKSQNMIPKPTDGNIFCF